MSNLDLISGEVVEDSDNRDAVTILAKKHFAPTAH